MFTRLVNNNNVKNLETKMTDTIASWSKRRDRRVRRRVHAQAA